MRDWRDYLEQFHNADIKGKQRIVYETMSFLSKSGVKGFDISSNRDLTAVYKTVTRNSRALDALMKIRSNMVKGAKNINDLTGNSNIGRASFKISNNEVKFGQYKKVSDTKEGKAYEWKQASWDKIKEMKKPKWAHTETNQEMEEIALDNDVSPQIRSDAISFPNVENLTDEFLNSIKNKSDSQLVYEYESEGQVRWEVAKVGEELRKKADVLIKQLREQGASEEFINDVRDSLDRAVRALNSVDDNVENERDASRTIEDIRAAYEKLDGRMQNALEIERGRIMKGADVSSDTRVKVFKENISSEEEVDKLYKSIFGSDE